MRWRSPGSLGSKRLPRTWWLGSWRKNLNGKWLHGRNTRKRRRKGGKREGRRKRQKKSKFSYCQISACVFVYFCGVSPCFPFVFVSVSKTYTMYPCLILFLFHRLWSIYSHLCVSLCISSIVSFCLSVVSLSVCLSVCPVPVPVPVSPSVCLSCSCATTRASLVLNAAAVFAFQSVKWG